MFVFYVGLCWVFLLLPQELNWFFTELIIPFVLILIVYWIIYYSFQWPLTGRTSISGYERKHNRLLGSIKSNRWEQRMPRAEQNQLPCPVSCWRHPQSILWAVCVQTKESHVGRGSGEKANPEANNKLYFPSVKHSVIWASQYAPPRKTGSSWVEMPRDIPVFKDLPLYLELPLVPWVAISTVDQQRHWSYRTSFSNAFKSTWPIGHASPGAFLLFSPPCPPRTPLHLLSDSQGQADGWCQLMVDVVLCPWASSWVWPMKIPGRKLEEERRVQWPLCLKGWPCPTMKCHYS